MIVLPGPVLLRDPLPAGWVRCPELGCGAPAGHDDAHVPEAVPPLPLPPALPREERETARPVAGPEVDGTPVVVRPGIMGGAPCIAGTRIPVSALVEMRRDGWTAGQIQRDGYPHVPFATVEAALAWADARPEVAVAAELSATVSARQIPVSATRYERIEAAARALLATDAAIDALGGADDIDEAALDEAYQDRTDAVDALRAALCSCTGHGPDLACVEHGEALRKWQARNAP